MRASSKAKIAKDSNSKKQKSGVIGKNRKLSARPPLARMMRLDELVRAGKLPTQGELAAEFDVSVRTIQRDVEYMQGQLKLPLEFDYSRNGYVYTREAPSLPNLQLTEGELLSLALARGALESYRGLNLDPMLAQTFDKLCHRLDEELMLSWRALRSVVSFQPAGYESGFDPRLFEITRAAAEELDELTILYRGLKDEKPRARRIHPLHLISFENAWYVFAVDPEARQIKPFALSRMTEAERTGDKFQRPRDFDSETYFSDGMGMFGGSSPKQVRLRFGREAVQRLRERKWHRSQEIRELEKGAAELRLRVSINPDLERWILMWGAQVEVLEPAELRQRIRNIAEEIGKLNEG